MIDICILQSINISDIARSWYIMIPKIIHFIWINKSQEFGPGEYASLLSALINTDYKIMLHTNLGPQTAKSKYNPYKLQSKWPRLTINKMDFEDTFEGVKAKIGNIADIYRIRLLYKYGGIYSDLDMFWFQNLDVDLKSVNYLACWENPSYKTVQNAFMAMAKGFPPAKGLLDEFRDVFRKVHDKGFTDISDMKELKYHILLFHATSNFSKKNADTILSKNYFFKNGWRRIGRELTRLKLPIKYQDQDYGKTNDTLSLDDITGFHFYNYLYPYSSIIKIPALRKKMKPILDEMP